MIVTLVENEPVEAEQDTLTFSEPTGIVAVADRAMWSGVENLPLPFGG